MKEKIYLSQEKDILRLSQEEIQKLIDSESKLSTSDKLWSQLLERDFNIKAFDSKMQLYHQLSKKNSRERDNNFKSIEKDIEQFEKTKDSSIFANYTEDDIRRVSYFYNKSISTEMFQLYEAISKETKTLIIYGLFNSKFNMKEFKYDFWCFIQYFSSLKDEGFESKIKNCLSKKLNILIHGVIEFYDNENYLAFVAQCVRRHINANLNLKFFSDRLYGDDKKTFTTVYNMLEGIKHESFIKNYENYLKKIKQLRKRE